MPARVRCSARYVIDGDPHLSMITELVVEHDPVAGRRPANARSTHHTLHTRQRMRRNNLRQTSTAMACITANDGVDLNRN